MRSKHIESQRTLTLNASGEALHIHNALRALVLVWKGSADMVLGTGQFLHSSQGAHEIPSVIQLRNYVKVPRESSITLTVRSVLARDKRKCGYQRPKLCEGVATTIDHIHPKGKGGKHVWENVVAACRKCNHKKGDKLLEDLGWELKIKPYRPHGPGAKLMLQANNPAWEPYLHF